ncbi:hypothetical protein BE18_51025 [Sorangium cellulosum]|uniref:Secreted protein n=1 Tax=Sorangium cellulosum TaxID=56 RepID=A0A150SME5_SORCE|nr:hypothetical protein BE18_51025 [Sorangium cellulosum]
MTSWLGAALLAIGPECAAGAAAEETTAAVERLGGSTSFVSADDLPTMFYGEEEEEEEEEEKEEEEEEQTELEEGDIYRVLGDGHLLNLNSYRGLQVIDIHDPESPAMVGQMPVAGTPVEMYVDGDRAIVLLNDWVGLRATPGSLIMDRRAGGAVLLIDLTNRNAPELLSQFDVPGTIQTSRYANGATRDALYVASTNWGWMDLGNDQYEWHNEAVVKSFEVTHDGLVERSQLDLGGYVTDIHGEGDVLLVARGPVGWDDENSQVSLVDISSVDGSMTLRDTVTVDGYVRSRFHMDFRDDMLRVFSGPQRGGGSSHLQTWDASDPDELAPIDKADFGDGQSLFGAVFLDDRAFAVTYLRVDPFHAFSIDPDGNIEEKSELIVSGWNDFFRPVLGATRLIGIGVNDEGGTRRLAASLYDITDLENPSPMLARAEVSGDEGGWSWSEASWDRRAFTVLDDAVSVEAPTGETETGLVLLPFTGDNTSSGASKHASGVQIFTFSGATLTRRGVMRHASPVRRSFRVDPSTAANVSETQLSLYDQRDLDAPERLGALDLAPSYDTIFAYGDHRVRIRNPEQDAGQREPDAMALAEVISVDDDAGMATPLATIPVPPDASYYKVGDDLLAVVTSRYVSWPDYETTISVVDFSDPRRPRAAGQLVTTALPPTHGAAHDDDHDQPTRVHVTNRSLTFTRKTDVWSNLGPGDQCDSHVVYAHGDHACTGLDGCTYYTGQRTCQSIDGGPEYCAGGFAACTTRLGARDACAPVLDEAALDGLLESCCYAGDVGRQIRQMSVHVVDLSDPDHPTLAPPLALPADEDAVSSLSHEGDVYVSVKLPAAVPHDPRPHARYFLRRVDLSHPGAPALGPAINIPGEALAIRGTKVFTRDRVWGPSFIEPALAKSTLYGGRAHLNRYHELTGKALGDTVIIDQHQRALLTYGERSWPTYWRWSYGDEPRSFAILRASDTRSSTGFDVLSETPVDRWMTLMPYAAERRAFFNVYGGTLMVDYDDPRSPVAQAFFHGASSPRVLLDRARDEVVVAAGRYGIHQLDLDASNLLP